MPKENAPIESADPPQLPPTEAPGSGGDPSAESEEEIVAASEIISEEPPEVTLEQVAADVQRHELATAQWFEVVRGDLGVLYERLDLLVQTVLGDPPPDVPEAAAPAPEPVEPVVAKVPPGQPVEQQANSGGFASRLLAAAAGPGDDDAGWEAVIFGQDLAGDFAIEQGRSAVIAGLKQQEPAAMALAGALLEVRSAPDDRVPQLLKDVGEAYYRWQPARGSGDDPFRNALIGWLEQKCERIGAGNKIVLVRVGDRYDSTRHNAKARGVEVSDVQGWVVLRDNGKVYTKATVALI